MDLLSIAIVPKRKKSNGTSDKDGCSRSLNDFHDSILKHILSFLPTRFAARTSTLSKRWQYMWTALPNLEFEAEGYEEREHFMDFVDKALILHNVAKIHKFSLKCLVVDGDTDVVSDVSRIRMWISGAVRRNAQEFDISFHDDPNYVDDESTKNLFPFCLFKCETMEVLKLQMYFFAQLPSQIYLPGLKILTLKGLGFKDYHTTNLLFASPALEQLKMEDCTWVDHKSAVVISAPKLWMLSILENEYEEWTNDLASSSVTICSPQLKFFCYDGQLIKNYHFHHPSSIIKVAFKFTDITEMPVDHFDELLRSVQLVEDLQLSRCCIEALSNATVPIFKNLVRLEILYRRVDLSCDELEIILNKCPRLKTLKFPQGLSFDSRTYKFERLLNLKFVYLPSTLKNIVIGNFDGNIKEVFAVQALLAQMTSLECLEVALTREGAEKRKEIETVLSVLPRGSKSCKLNIR